jgi:hypothetical protein
MNIIINNSILRKLDSRLLFAIGLLICVFIAFFKESIFPEKYFFDSHRIQNLIEHPYKDEGDAGFTNTAIFYRYLHIDRFFLAPLLTVISYFSVIVFVFRKYNVKTVSFFNLLLIVTYSTMAMVYMSTYSKEFVLFLFIVVPFVLFEKKYLLVWTLFVILYASFFRSYWFIIILMFWGIKYFVVKTPRILMIVIPVFYFLISFVYNYIFGVPLSMIRYLTNLDRDAESAQTAIAIFIEGNNFAVEAVNFIVTLIFLIIPIPLILLGKPFYIILALLIIMFFFNFIKLYWKENKNKEYTNVFSFVIAFMLVQSLFEPDYGSFVKHLSPLFPIIFICIARNTKFIEAEE